MIQIDQLTVSKLGRRICELNSLKVAGGERVAVVGKNGVGKTTLLRVIAGLETEFGGTRKVSEILQNCSYVHQSPYMFRGTVSGNISYGIKRKSTSLKEREKHIAALMEQLGISHLAHTNASRLSGGEKKKVAIARAIAIKPDLLILDEPFAEIDSDGIESINQLFELNPEMTIIISSPNTLPGCWKGRVEKLECDPQ